MTSVTMKTYPSPKIESLILALSTTEVANPRPIFDMIAYLLSQWPSMGDSGLSGYSYFFPSIPNPFDGGATIVGGIFMAVVLQDSSPEAMRALWEPVLSHINTTWPGYQLIWQPKSFPSYLGWYSENYDTSAAGKNSYIGSRLLDRVALTANLTKSSAAYEGFANGTLATAYLVSGKGVHNAHPRGCGNAVLPAWRKAYVHASKPLRLSHLRTRAKLTHSSPLAFGIDAPPLDQAAAVAVRKQVKGRVAALRELAPDMGAYVNEVRDHSTPTQLCPATNALTPQADFEEPNFQQEFWGSNYKRLYVSHSRTSLMVTPADAHTHPASKSNAPSTQTMSSGALPV